MASSATSQDAPTPFSLVVTCASKIDGASLYAHHQHLSQSQLRALAEAPYDNGWMNKYNISPDVLQSFCSRLKFDHVILYGAVKNGDYLFTDTIYLANTRFIRMGKMGQIDTTGPKKKYPDIQYGSFCDDPALCQEDLLPDCRGPRQLMEAFCQIGLPERLGATDAWRRLHVLRNGRDLGSLHDIRQALHYYQMITEGWILATGRSRRAMRKQLRAVNRNAVVEEEELDEDESDEDEQEDEDEEEEEEDDEEEEEDEDDEEQGEEEHESASESEE